jgi:predicted O-linked N-acetylglucosamine transferase (SPINDLY family)
MLQETIAQMMQEAMSHHQAGRLVEAEALYRKVLVLQPDDPDALHMLGVIRGQAGRNDIAVDMIRKAIAASPNDVRYRLSLGIFLQRQGKLDQAADAYQEVMKLMPEYPNARNNLGIIFWQQGKLDQAIECYQQAVKLNPNYWDAYFNLGIASKDKGHLDEAITAYGHALAIKPDYPEAENNLGMAWKDKGNLDQAIASYHRAVALNPAYFEAYNNLGNALMQKGELDQALVSYHQALKVNPNYGEAHRNLATMLVAKGRIDEAITSCRRAVELEPNSAEAHHSHGNALKIKGQLDQAIACFRKALTLKPGFADAHLNLGNALNDKGHLDEARSSYQRALDCKPDFYKAISNLGNVSMDAGQTDQAIACFRQALDLDPDLSNVHSCLLMALQYHPSIDAQQRLLVESRNWGGRYASPLSKQIRPHHNERNDNRRLRIGYVSADFRHHVVSFFMLALLSSHDHEKFEIFCYAQVAAPDTMTARLQKLADTWRSIMGLTDEQVIEMIRADQIDILVDLAGHTADNRLLVFAAKPAPVQITYLGYPGTTGVSTIDYRLTDALADPPGMTDAFYSEKLFRLPKTAWCFSPPENTPAAGELPALKTKSVTFGCFNNFAKVNLQHMKLWANILLSVPGSRLIIKSKVLTAVSIRQHVQQVMGDAGIEPHRLDLHGWMSAAGHILLYGQVDIALDTYPYHGTTTTCEAMWMGVPVVTLAGQSHVSRVGVSLLSNVGLPELIAQTPEQYVQIAVDLAKDLPRLIQLRSTLRQRMEKSPLMDAAAFAKGIEGAYRMMWRKWCGETGSLE